ncbi:cilia- and flagella-associated protein 61 [Colletes latitarsis]|uniref:cilia- and flagella-associated protein 61 n=1 Tax=Colletes latitarsis TaxID=2605962 RepID=UPI0040373CD3
MKICRANRSRSVNVAGKTLKTQTSVWWNGIELSRSCCKMMNFWFDEARAVHHGRKSEDVSSEILLTVRRMEHSDLPILERLIQPDTFEIFGETDLGRIYEASCLSVVQCNEKRDVVSGMCLCNYPNVPSVIPQDWPAWLDTLYGLENVTERNSMFVHFLVWDRRYTGHFFEDLLTGLFDVASYLLHVILVLPPRVIPADVFEQQMIRISSKCSTNTYSVQSLYVTVRHWKNSRLRIRRIVEEDNDLVIPIIGAESRLVEEFYGEYYVSEMVRYPNDYRQLIVSEDHDGLATGAMFLNRRVDVDVLNENFELGPYNGLRKPSEDDVFPPGSMEPSSETYFSIFSGKPRTKRIYGDSLSMLISAEDLEEPNESNSLQGLNDRRNEKFTEKPIGFSKSDILTEPSIIDNFSDNYGSKMQTSVFQDTLLDIPREFERLAVYARDGCYFFNEGRLTVPSIKSSEMLPPKEIQLPPQPIYRGEVNAFVLEIFARQPQIKNRCCRNFLEAAFECFPDLDYCVILLPSSHPFLPFLENFVRVPLRCNRDFPMTLYATHRASLLGRITTREGLLEDWEDVCQLLRGIPKAENTLSDLEAAVTKRRSDLFCYVFQWNDAIIGVAILCTEKDVAFIKRRYHVEDYMATQNVAYDAHGCILHFVLTPIFSVHLRFFFREIMRLSGLAVLYYRLEERALSALVNALDPRFQTRSQPLATCLDAMVFVNPRQRIEYKFRGYVETDKPKTTNEPFALFMTTPRLAILDHFIVDTKVVVVGASDCGVAFMEHLALGSTLDSVRFANLTLISPNGLPFEKQHGGAIVRSIPFRGRYCRDYRRLVVARAWINVIYGTVVTINRKEKYVTVMNQGNITYDYLILTCGLQYQRPRFREELEAHKSGEFPKHETPWNCLTINDDMQAVACLEKIQLSMSNFQDERRIVLYGHNIDCYCALQGLLESGINGAWITLIEPPLPANESRESVFFDDCEVYVETMNSISNSGVEVLVDWELIDWHLRSSIEGKFIEAIVLRSEGRTRTMECDVFVNFNEKTINMELFLAICRSGLVFDGQLVIDPEFRTNDPSIFAAGTVTKYSRKFCADSQQHKYYNSVEIGTRVSTADPGRFQRLVYFNLCKTHVDRCKLAKVLRSAIDTQQRGSKVSSLLVKSKACSTPPLFRSANVVACTLPGGYRYLHVRKPGKPVPRKQAIRCNSYGSVLKTGSCASEIGYFRIRLNRFDSVESITCCNKKEFELHHVIKLYGKHESLLNELKTRFQKSLISDLYAYFREPWAMAIFYDRFECLRVENRATLLSKTAIPGSSLVDDCIRALVKSKWEPKCTRSYTITNMSKSKCLDKFCNNDDRCPKCYSTVHLFSFVSHRSTTLQIPENDRRRIEEKYAGSVYQQELEESLLDFLQFSEEDIPVYCTPGKLRELYADNEDSPLYTYL